MATTHTARRPQAAAGFRPAVRQVRPTVHSGFSRRSIRQLAPVAGRQAHGCTVRRGWVATKLVDGEETARLFPELRRRQQQLYGVPPMRRGGREHSLLMLSGSSCRTRRPVSCGSRLGGSYSSGCSIEVSISLFSVLMPMLPALCSSDLRSNLEEPGNADRTSLSEFPVSRPWRARRPSRPMSGMVQSTDRQQ